MDIEGTTMSLWDVVKGVGRVVKDIAKQPFDIGRELITGQSKNDIKKQQQMMNDQIKAYNEQTKLAKDELARAKDSQIAEKRRIQEKQIRSLRRNASSRGFLGTSNDMSAMNQSSSLGG